MPAPDRPTREIVTNRKARRDYEILDRMECGLVLTGTEIKSIRNGRVSLAESYVKQRNSGLWLIGAHIDEYRQGNIHNHEPTRDRQLLLHKRELQKWSQKSKEKGLTMVPLKMFFRGKWAKVEVGLGRGRKLHDKREVVKNRESKRDVRRALGRG